MSKEPTVADLLKEARAAKRQTLRSAAEALGVDASYLSRLENGDREPSPAVKAKVTEYYGLEADLVQLASGNLPQDIVDIIKANPGLIDRLRREYGQSG